MSPYQHYDHVSQPFLYPLLTFLLNLLIPFLSMISAFLTLRSRRIPRIIANNTLRIPWGDFSILQLLSFFSEHEVRSYNLIYTCCLRLFALYILLVSKLCLLLWLLLLLSNLSLTWFLHRPIHTVAASRYINPSPSSIYNFLLQIVFC